MDAGTLLGAHMGEMKDAWRLSDAKYAKDHSLFFFTDDLQLEPGTLRVVARDGAGSWGADC